MLPFLHSDHRPHRSLPPTCPRAPCSWPRLLPGKADNQLQGFRFCSRWGFVSFASPPERFPRCRRSPPPDVSRWSRSAICKPRDPFAESTRGRGRGCGVSGACRLCRDPATCQRSYWGFLALARCTIRYLLRSLPLGVRGQGRIHHGPEEARVNDFLQKGAWFSLHSRALRCRLLWDLVTGSASVPVGHSRLHLATKDPSDVATL